MTAAERMRRYRSQPQPKHPGVKGKDLAAYVGRSQRYVAYLAAWQRHRLIDWDASVIDGKHGKVGMAFLAEVCRLADAEAQQAINDAIKNHGAAFGRKLWRHCKADMARLD